MPPKTAAPKATKKTTEPKEEVAATPVPEVKAPVEPPKPVFVETVVAAAEQAPAETTASEVSNIEVLFNKYITQISDVINVVKTLHSNLKVLQKEVLKERKELLKKAEKSTKKVKKDRPASGIALPTPIPDTIASFLGLPSGSKVARTEVTAKVIAYVKENKLQNPDNKRFILPDEKLKSLLKPVEGDDLTFFKIQTYLKKIFDSEKVVV